jgi:glucose-6-phosphate isomerase
LIGIWNRNFFSAPTHAVLPYDDHLLRFPAYLQQLEMESNGTSVRRSGDPFDCPTCPVIWGEPGSHAQLSFCPRVPPGPGRGPIAFLLPALSAVGRQEQHDLAAANCLAQAWALAEGDPAGAARSPHQRYPGNRGSSLLLFERLDPTTLGKLVALYEHKVYVQGVIWDVNSFDQWGVQLGKRLASQVTPYVSGDGGSESAPRAIDAAIRSLRELRRKS